MSAPNSLASLHCRARSRRRAFTLIEVALALGIALGLLAVVLFFYQQISRLRDATLSSSAALATVRLSMDRLATQLRTACPIPGSFRGGAEEVEFVGNGFDPSYGTARTNEDGTSAIFPVRRIRYTLVAATNGAGGGGGLQWVEEPYSPGASAVITNDTTQESFSNTNAGFSSADMFSSNSQPDSPESTDLFAMPGSSDTNLSTLENTNSTVQASSLPARGAVVFPGVRYFHLRYWDGATWLDSWTEESLPRGVEISLGTEAPGSEGTPNEFFRRVIALPLVAVADSTTTNEPTDTMGSALPTDDSGEVSP